MLLAAFMLSAIPAILWMKLLDPLSLGMWIVYVFAIFYLVINAFLFYRASRRKTIPEINFAIRISKYEQKSLTLTQEALTRVINETLGPEGKLQFPRAAPRLVELDTSVIVPSETSSFLLDFVFGHESSAIGISGPRGSGKSTLMRGLVSDGRARRVWMSAPVRHDSVEFLKRLCMKVALEIDESLADDVQITKRRRSYRVLLVRGVLGVILLVLGLAMLALDYFARHLILDVRLGVWGFAGLFILLIGLLLLTATLLLEMRTLPARSAVATQKDSFTLARDVVVRLNFDTESSSKRKNVISLLSKSLSLEDEDAVTLKERALSHVEIIDDLRRLLESFAKDVKPKRIVVVIDELDKISSASGLVDTINDMKDLLHIAGVHFIVSVSTEALASFEQRGFVTRDAFDSTFDVIIPVEALRLDDSLSIIAARAEGFPPIVGAFCHAWSGGLPRELLRIARRCVEIQRTRTEIQPVELLVRTVLAEDIVTVVESRMRATDDASERAALMVLRERGKRLREGEIFRTDVCTYGPALGSLAEVVALAESLYSYFTLASKTRVAAWSTPDDVREALEAAARAMSRRGEAPEIRAEAFSEAMMSLESQLTAIIQRLAD